MEVEQHPHEGPRQSEPGGFSERVLRRGMRINIVAGSLGMVWVAVCMGMPLTMFMESLKASGVVIGLTVTVQQVAMLLQIPSALFVERLPSRKPYWAALTIVQRLLWFLPALLPFLMRQHPQGMATAMVAVVGVSAVLIHLGAAPWWSWMADLIPERMRGSFWGKRQSIVMAANLAAVWVAGYLLDVFAAPGEAGGSYRGFSLVFCVGAVLGVADIVIHLWVPEPPARPVAARERVFTRAWALFREPDFRRLTLAVGAWTFALGAVGQFGLLHLKRDFGVTYTQLSAITISATLGVILASMLWGYAMDRLGPRNLGAVTMIVAPCFGLVWFFMRDVMVSIPVPWGVLSLPQPVLLLLVTNLVAGAFYSGVGLAQVGLLSALSPREGRTLAMAVHWSVVGLLAALGPVAGGAVMDWVEARSPSWVMPTGTRFSFFHLLVCLQMLVTWGLALPLLLRVRRRTGEVRVSTAFSRLLVGNPLRAVSSIYNIYAMGASVDSRKRANAVRRVGNRRTAIAVTDLIEKLEDPATEVREEAVLALGRIGSPEAVKALLVKLNDPHSDVLPQVARALREARSPESVEALVNHLSDSDRETVAETARALGEIGDRRAAADLLRLLRGSDDPKVVSASSEALARLGEMAAIYEILPRMQCSPNPVLKRSLAVAVGDLLGQPGEFYRVLVLEQRSRTEEAERMLARLGDAVRLATRDRMREQGDILAGKAAEVAVAYEAMDFRCAVDLLLELAVGLAALRSGIRHGNDAAVLVEVLVWQDEQLGLALWFLQLLRERCERDPAAEPDAIDVLLGIYALVRRAPEGGAAPREPVRGSRGRRHTADG